MRIFSNNSTFLCNTLTVVSAGCCMQALVIMISFIRMQRNKGQFTSSKKSEGESGWGSAQDSGQDEAPQETS